MIGILPRERAHREPNVILPKEIEPQPVPRYSGMTKTGEGGCS